MSIPLPCMIIPASSMVGNAPYNPMVAEFSSFVAADLFYRRSWELAHLVRWFSLSEGLFELRLCTQTREPTYSSCSDTGGSVINSSSNERAQLCLLCIGLTMHFFVVFFCLLFIE